MLQKKQWKWVAWWMISMLILMLTHSSFHLRSLSSNGIIYVSFTKDWIFWWKCFLIVQIITHLTLILCRVESRKPERYSSAAPLSRKCFPFNSIDLLMLFSIYLFLCNHHSSYVICIKFWDWICFEWSSWCASTDCFRTTWPYRQSSDFCIGNFMVFAPLTRRLLLFLVFLPWCLLRFFDPDRSPKLNLPNIKRQENMDCQRRCWLCSFW